MPTNPYDALSLETLHGRPCSKWTRYEPDVLPLWVAEMDYPVADAIKRAIADHAASDNLGYGLARGLPGLAEAIAARLHQRYAWSVPGEAVHPLASTVQGLYLAAAAFAGPGDEVLLLTPLYPPFRNAVAHSGRVPIEVELRDGEGGYALDLDALEAAVTPATRILMLCNPHNPVGRVFRREELVRLADFALRHNLWVVSDELHADLVFDGAHLPIASLDPELAARTITLYGPTKAFNIPGLKVSFAIAEDAAVRERLASVGRGLASGPNVIAQAATIAAYRQAGAWFDATMAYLRANRDHLLDRLASEAPRVRMHAPEATYLAWLDLRATGLGDDPAATLLERARVALNAGPDYGPGGAGFARLNFATSRAILDAALDRMLPHLQAS